MRWIGVWAKEHLKVRMEARGPALEVVEPDQMHTLCWAGAEGVRKHKRTFTLFYVRRRPYGGCGGPLQPVCAIPLVSQTPG